MHEGDEIAATDIRGHSLDSTRSFVQDLIAPRRLINIGDLLEQNVSAAGTAQWQVADLGDIVPAGSVENRNDVEDLIAFIGLPDDIALIGRTDQFEHLNRIEAPTLQIGLAEADRELRQAWRRLDLNVGRAGDFAECTGNLLRLLIEQVEVVAEHVDHNRGGIARERLLDALGQKSHDRGVHADEPRKGSADIRLRLFGLVSRQSRLQINFELTVVRAPGVFGLLGTPRALRNRAHFGQLPQRLGDMGADSQRFVDRCAGDRRHVNDEVPLLQFGNEPAAKKRQRSTTGNCQQGGCGDERARTFGKPPQQRLIAGAGPSDHRRIVRRHLAREEHHRQRWRQRQRDGE